MDEPHRELDVAYDDQPHVEVERDPLVLTPSDDAALPPEVDYLADNIEVVPSSTPISQPEALPATAGAGNATLLIGGSLALAVLLALIGARALRLA